MDYENNTHDCDLHIVLGLVGLHPSLSLGLA